MRARRSLSLFTAVVAVVMALAPAYAMGQRKQGAQIIPPNGEYKTLSAKFWQWALSMPVHDPADYTKPFHPLWDWTGECAANGQDPKSNVFFLGGAMGAFNPDGSVVGVVDATVTRNVTIPAGKQVFVAILNCEWDSVGLEVPFTVQEMRDASAAYVDAYTDVFASLDGTAIDVVPTYRTKSPVFFYELPPADNIYQVWGMDVTGRWKAISDGYYLLLAPLSTGTHQLHFGGTASGGSFVLDITYNITVP